MSGGATMVEGRGALGWLWLTATVVAVDQITKAWVQATLTVHQPVPVLPGLDLTLTFNRGAAFSFLSDAGGWQRWLLSAVALVVSAAIVAWLARMPRAAGHRPAAGLALVLGGALGNLWDRLALGVVVDFIDAHWRAYHWPAFNVADAAITVGAAILLLHTFLGRAGDHPGS